jgi:hypothetical protein
MGFPFDRKADTRINTLEDFMRPYPNMKANEFSIRFTNTIVARTQ